MHSRSPVSPVRTVLRIDPRKLVLLVASLVACTSREAMRDSTYVSQSSPDAQGLTRVGTLVGMHGPESVRYDPAQDVLFVSNMLGYGSDKDGAGYIDRVNAGELSSVSHFVQGGVNGVTLNAPKGMALQGDTLWVADIDVLRGFDRRSGAPVATIDLAGQGAVLLNDVTVGPDGRVYVTDSGMQMTDKGVLYTGGDKIFAVGPGRSASIIAQGASLGHPNGITWDTIARRLLVVNFDPFKSRLDAMRAGDTTRTTLATGKGRFDGVEVLADGRILYTSWNDSSVHVVANGKDEQLVHPVPAPADIGIDTKRNRLVVPLSADDKIEVFQLPPLDSSALASSRTRIKVTEDVPSTKPSSS